jgi:hypothetical protein
MIKEYINNKEFLNSHLEYLEKNEIKNNLIIGVAQKANNDSDFFVSSEINGMLLLGVLAGKKLIISANTLNEDPYIEMINYLRKTSYPGIIGEKETCLIYSKVFQRLISKPLVEVMKQRIYYCDKILSDYCKTEVFRLAKRDDFEVLRFWINDFYKEIGEELKLEESDKIVLDYIDNNRLFVLEVAARLVSMAGRTRPLRNSETVSMVYTPKTLRKKGFASKVVEGTTRVLMQEKKMVTLYTDLSNPTSNSIYMKIGFKPYCDSLVMEILK